MQVRELMTQPAATCRTTDHLDTPARLMWECDCGSVPVVDEDGRLAGMITDRDITMAAYTTGEPLRSISVGQVMSREVLAVQPDAGIDEVEKLMREGQVRRIPIIDTDGRPKGIVSLNDLARTAMLSRPSRADRVLVETLAVICQPRTTAAV